MNIEPFRVLLSNAARFGLRELQEKYGGSALDESLGELLALEEDPVPQGAQLLRGTMNHYRIYLYRSLYRAVYRLLREKRLVIVERRPKINGI